MTDISGQKSEVSSQKLGFIRVFTLSPLPFALSLLCALLFALCVSAAAQQPKRVPQIGYLSSGNTATDSARTEGIRLALRERGYIEGQNIVIEYRYAEGSAIGLLTLRGRWFALRLISFL
jgi:hypothetical protein